MSLRIASPDRWHLNDGAPLLLPTINQTRTMRKCLFSLNESFHILTQTIYTIALLVNRTTYTLFFFFCIFFGGVVIYWVVSSSLWPHGLQHHRLLCPSISPDVCSNSCPLSWWSYLTSSSSSHSSHPTSTFAFKLSEHQSLLQWVVSLHQVAKVLELQPQSFQWMSGLISFRIDWLDLLALQRTLSTLQFKSISSLALSLLNGPSLIFVHDCWKNHSFDYMDHVGKVSLCFLILSSLVLALFPRSKRLLISSLHILSVCEK